MAASAVCASPPTSHLTAAVHPARKYTRTVPLATKTLVFSATANTSFELDLSSVQLVPERMLLMPKPKSLQSVPHWLLYAVQLVEAKQVEPKPSGAKQPNTSC